MSYLTDLSRAPTPAFDPPPRFAGADRRTGAQVAAVWTEIADDPAAFVALMMAREGLGAMIVTVERLASGEVVARDVGEAIGTCFGLRPGPLGDQLLARQLAWSLDECALTALPVRFEGTFPRTPGEPPTLLARGTMVPLDGAGRITSGCAVMSWKELLSPAGHDRLRRELGDAGMAAFAPDAAPPRRR